MSSEVYKCPMCGKSMIAIELFPSEPAYKVGARFQCECGYWFEAWLRVSTIAQSGLSFPIDSEESESKK